MEGGGIWEFINLLETEMLPQLISARTVRAINARNSGFILWLQGSKATCTHIHWYIHLAVHEMSLVVKLVSNVSQACNIKVKGSLNTRRYHVFYDRKAKVDFRKVGCWSKPDRFWQANSCSTRPINDRDKALLPNLPNGRLYFAFLW